mmetsp:Transcript_31033/g.47329  ORF Transcript_31033/g.47329 Transcript_31033/m.47329 type:complete len:96 (-) Transcript_31033:75-362(-)
MNVYSPYTEVKIQKLPQRRSLLIFLNSEVELGGTIAERKQGMKGRQHCFTALCNEENDFADNMLGDEHETKRKSIFWKQTICSENTVRLAFTRAN